MGSKLIHIQAGVYFELASFKDEEGLKSFTAAIKELLRRNRQKHPRIDVTEIPHIDYEGNDAIARTKDQLITIFQHG